jgi:hypothetical protein
MARHVAHGVDEICVGRYIFVESFGGKRTLGRHLRTWEDNTTVDVRYERNKM